MKEKKHHDVWYKISLTAKNPPGSPGDKSEQNKQTHVWSADDINTIYNNYYLFNQFGYHDSVAPKLPVLLNQQDAVFSE